MKPKKVIKAWGVFQDGKFWRAESNRGEARAVAYPGQQVKRIEVRVLPNAGNRKSA